MSSDTQRDLHDDEFYMGEALRQAKKAFEAGETPVGAVIVHNGKIIARAHNQVELLKDATAHAEILAITQAASALGDWRLVDCTLYVTKEPCPMCAGAIMLSRIKRVVYGAPDCKAGGLGGAIDISKLQGLNHKCEVVGGVRVEECSLLLKEFFRRLRHDSSASEGKN